MLSAALRPVTRAPSTHCTLVWQHASPAKHNLLPTPARLVNRTCRYPNRPSEKSRIPPARPAQCVTYESTGTGIFPVRTSLAATCRLEHHLAVRVLLTVAVLILTENGGPTWATTVPGFHCVRFRSGIADRKSYSAGVASFSVFPELLSETDNDFVLEAETELRSRPTWHRPWC